MKKYIKNIIGYICFGIIVFEYIAGLIKSWVVGDATILVVMTIGCLSCLALLNMYLNEA